MAQPCSQAPSCCSVQSLLRDFQVTGWEGWSLLIAAASVAALLGGALLSWPRGEQCFFPLSGISIPTGAYVDWFQLGLTDALLSEVSGWKVTKVGSDAGQQPNGEPGSLLEAT